MAIHRNFYHCLRELHSLGELPQGGMILEIGEANYYGDMPVSEMKSDIARITPDLYEANKYCGELRDIVERRNACFLFEIAKFIYKLFFGTERISAIDMNGTQEAMRLDMNSPLDLQSEFNTVFNGGTAEHIFNVANVFRIMHDHCAVGGLMIHESPFTGWVDHGFYNINPTLFYDLAAANGYGIVYIAVHSLESESVRIERREQILELAGAGKLPDNALLFVALRKLVDEPFRLPMQGYYTRTLSAEANQAWAALR